MAVPSINQNQIALDPVSGIFFYRNSNGSVVSSSLNLLQLSNTDISTEDSLTVDGNLTVNGTVISVNTESVLVEDNFIILNTGAAGENSLNSGIEIERGTLPNVIIRWNESLDKWEFTNDGTNFFELSAANANTSGSAASWTTPRVITLGGDLSGNVTIDGSQDVTLNASVVANSVTLGTDTVGNYVDSISSGLGISISNSSSEGSIHNIALDASLNDLNDVQISNAANGEFLRVNNAGVWINDAVNLSTDTIGDYVENIIAGTGVSISNAGGEGSIPTLSIGQPVATNSNVSFQNVTASFSGNLSGNVTGDLSGNTTGHHFGNVTGNVSGDLSGNVTGNVTGDVNGNASAWTTARKITLEGDLSGNVFIKGNADVTLNASIVANSVELGVDTTGLYVANLVEGTGITITDNDGESMTPVIKISNSYTEDMLENISNAEANAAAYSETMANTAYSNAIAFVANVTLNDLSGVTLSNTVSNEFLKYNGNVWINDALDISDISAFTINNPQENQVLLWDSNSNTWVNGIVPESFGVAVDIPPFGDGNTTVWPITHNLDRSNVVVTTTMLNQVSGKYEVVNVLWEITNSNVVTFFFESPPPEDSVKVTIFASVQSTSLQPTSLAGLNQDVLLSSPGAGDFLKYNGFRWINDHVSMVDIADVNLSNVSNNQYLKYDSNSSTWIPSAIPQINSINDISDVVITNAAANEFLKFDGNTWINDNVSVINNLDDINNVIISNVQANEFLKFDGNNWVNSLVPVINSVNDIADVVITSPEEFQSITYNGINWVNSYAPVVSYVRNAESNTLTTGTVVYLFGGTGDHATIKRADNSSDLTSSKTVGVVGVNISASQNGPVITRGYIDGIDLSTGYSEGDVLWLGKNGQFTKVKPSAPDHLVFVGVVVRATNNGIIYVATQNGYEIEELHDVSISNTLAAGDFLKYNGSLWVNDPINLGTDTVGNYMVNVSAGLGISISHTQSEGSTANIALNANIDDLLDVSAATPSNGDYLKYVTNTWVNSSITLGTDTQGNYIYDVIGGTGISVSHTPGEGSSPTLSIGQDVGTNASVQFANVQSNSLTISGNSISNNLTINSNITSGNITVNNALIADSLTVNTDLTVNGNLTVQGNSVVLNTEVLTVEDNEIVLNASSGTVTPQNSGIKVDRGVDGSNVQRYQPVLRWNESGQKWQVSNDGTTYGNIVTVVDIETVSSSMIANASIDNSKVSNTANIAYSKLNLSNNISTTDLQAGPARGGFNSTLDLKTTSYTLQTSDLAKLIIMNSSSNTTITVPQNLLSDGDRIDVLRYGTGEVSIQAGANASVLATPGLKLRAQYSGATLVRIDSNNWVLFGDLKL